MTTFRTLDRYTADVGCDPEPTPAEDLIASFEQRGRAKYLKAVRDAISTAKHVVNDAHKRHGLNLCDVQDYLTHAAEAVESEEES